MFTHITTEGFMTMGFGSLSPLSLIVNEVLGSYSVFFYEFVSDLVFLVDRMLQD